MLDGVPHVVGDHQGGQVVLFNDAVRGVQYLGGSLGVQSRRVLVQKQQLGLNEGGHQQRQCLALAAGQEAHLAGEPVLQPQVQDLQPLNVLLPLCLGDACPQGAALAPAGGQCQIFLDLHGGGSAQHGVLEHPADVFGPLVLRHVGQVHAADGNAAGVHRPHAGHGIEQGGLTGAVAADDGDKVAVVQMQGKAPQGGLFVDGAGVEGFPDVFDLKHLRHLLS